MPLTMALDMALTRITKAILGMSTAYLPYPPCWGSTVRWTYLPEFPVLLTVNGIRGPSPVPDTGGAGEAGPLL